LNTSLHYVRSYTDVDLLHVYENTYSAQQNISYLNDIGAKVELDWMPSEYHHISAGAGFTEYLLDSRRNHSSEPETDNLFKLNYDISEVALHAADEISISNWFKTNIGLRYSLTTQGETTYHSIEPRAALRFQLNDATALKFSYTEMSQAIHLLRAHYVDLPMSSWLPSTNEIPPMRSRQIAGGVYANLPHNISLSIEGYWKNMMNLYEYCGINSIYPDLMNWEEELVMGKGRSYGGEIEMRWRSEKMDVAAYYTLSWTERYFEDIWPTWYPARNDTRHKFNINATRRFTGKFEMYASWNYTSGNRMTVPSQIIGSEIYYTSPYNHKLPDYHRLDIGFNFRKTTKRGNESIWNLSIYNAYCRLNPMFYMTNTITDIYGENKRIVLKQCAMIPILPSFSYTLRF
jgi:hypothetical protein